MLVRNKVTGWRISTERPGAPSNPELKCRDKADFASSTASQYVLNFLRQFFRVDFLYSRPVEFSSIISRSAKRTRENRRNYRQYLSKDLAKKSAQNLVVGAKRWKIRSKQSRAGKNGLGLGVFFGGVGLGIGF